MTDFFLSFRSDGLNQHQPQQLQQQQQQQLQQQQQSLVPTGVGMMNPGVSMAQPMAMSMGQGMPGAAVPMGQGMPGAAVPMGQGMPGAAVPMGQPGIPGVGPGMPGLGQGMGPGMPGSLFSGPPGGLLPYQQAGAGMVQPQMINVPPMTLQAPQQHFVDASGNVVPMPAAYPMQQQQQQQQQQQPQQQPQMYPGVHNAYQGQGYYMPPGGMPPPQQGMYPAAQYPQPAHPPHTPGENFRFEGVLEYGQLTTVHFRDKTSNFRGLPDFLRRELQKTYGKFPATDIRIVAQNGEFHIYATPRSEGEEFLEGGASSSRMIGFNEVRGDAR